MLQLWSFRDKLVLNCQVVLEIKVVQILYCYYYYFNIVKIVRIQMLAHRLKMLKEVKRTRNGPLKSTPTAESEAGNRTPTSASWAARGKIQKEMLHFKIGPTIIKLTQTLFSLIPSLVAQLFSSTFILSFHENVLESFRFAKIPHGSNSLCRSRCLSHKIEPPHWF